VGEAPPLKPFTERLTNLLPLGAATALDSSVFDMDSIIDAKEFQIERKRFHVEFRENDRGKFLRITEEAHGRRNTIIVPSTGVGDFTAAIGEVLHASHGAAAN
jgi:hypothetical protein